MASESASKEAPKSGMSLYANLIADPTDAPGTISGAPVIFKQSSEAAPQTDDSATKKQQVNTGNYFERI